ncbi:hypothetical protein RchiOBHm_Chr6g0295311 [Rosa chinensis]|uniref:Uncharacterized protein n=1 Tax=Rosa chinensis TaxID=74649 RepID=A0A2P6PX54_ROSCH|nr:hypothetical protein RchiOBHm_Chr6g0295311 [Rosa chinensis]
MASTQISSQSSSSESDSNSIHFNSRMTPNTRKTKMMKKMKSSCLTRSAPL